MAETKDGRVLFFARSTCGADRAELQQRRRHDLDPRPPTGTGRPVFAPATGPDPQDRRPDVCLESGCSRRFRRGFRRGRLSAAISQDSGATWSHLQDAGIGGGLEDVARVTPGRIEMVIRARKDVGRLPNDYAFFHYANVCFAGDKVYLLSTAVAGRFSGRRAEHEPAGTSAPHYPLDWFFQ